MSDYFLADDLSGALDAAAAFHGAGRRVRIALTQDAWESAAKDEVVAITTETRNASPSRAAARVTDTLERARRDGHRLLYKKIDSTLRGPVAAELAAVMQALPAARVLFAPANPRVGRTVEKGVLCVQGVPVAETPFGRDPGSPLRTSVVREILGPVASDRVVVPDTLSDADLAAAVAAMNASGDEWVAVGSGALAVFVARARTGGDASRGGADTRAPRTATGPILMIGGSAHPLNRAQAAHLAEAHGLTVHELAFDAPLTAGRAAAEALRRAGGALLQMPVARVEPRAALQALIEASAHAIKAAGVDRVFTTGGETAFALCEYLGITSLVFVEEIEAGLALACGETRDGPLLLAVKPGGFGDEQTWKRAWSRLSRG